MPQMKSLAPVRIASRSGHVVVVSPEGSFVPDVLVPEALSRGCVEATDCMAPQPSGGVDSTQLELSLPIPSGGPTDTRMAQIREAITKLIENNDPADFTATGVPRVAAVRRMFEDTVTSEEIAEAMLLVRGG